MKMKTGELIGDALDWAVAHALGPEGHDELWLKDRKRGYKPFYSRTWEYGGWLLEQCIEHGMLIERIDPQYEGKLPKFKASLDKWESLYRGDTLLVAVCRAYAAYKLGPEVEIPQAVLELTAA